jgi:two-component system response regulator HydG
VLPLGLVDLPYADAKREALKVFHRAYLDTLLGRTEGNVAEAARRAGLDRANFRRVQKREKKR